MPGTSDKRWCHLASAPGAYAAFRSVVLDSSAGDGRLGVDPTAADEERWRSVYRDDGDPRWAQPTVWPEDCGLEQLDGPDEWPSLVKIENDVSPLVDHLFRAALVDAGLVDGWQTIPIPVMNLEGHRLHTHELVLVRDRVAAIELDARSERSRPRAPIRPSVLDEIISDELRYSSEPPPLSIGTRARLVVSPAAARALTDAKVSGVKLIPMLRQDEVDERWWLKR